MKLDEVTPQPALENEVRKLISMTAAVFAAQIHLLAYLTGSNYQTLFDLHADSARGYFADAAKTTPDTIPDNGEGSAP